MVDWLAHSGSEPFNYSILQNFMHIIIHFLCIYSVGSLFLGVQKVCGISVAPTMNWECQFLKRTSSFTASICIHARYGSGVGSRNFVSLNSINLHDLPVKILPHFRFSTPRLSGGHYLWNGTEYLETRNSYVILTAVSKLHKLHC